MAEHHSVRATQHSEQRTSTPTVLACPLDQTRYLHKLHEHTTDTRQRGHRSERGKGIVADLDLNVGERVQQAGLPSVRRPDQRDLGSALSPHAYRVVMYRTGAGTSLVYLIVHPLAQVGVRTVAIAGQLRQYRAQFSHALGPLLADKTTLDDLHLSTMRHGHGCKLL